MILFCDGVELTLLSVIDSFEMVVGECSEIELLVGVEVHRFGDDPKLHGFERRRAFRYDDDIRPVLS